MNPWRDQLQLFPAVIIRRHLKQYSGNRHLRTNSWNGLQLVTKDQSKYFPHLSRPKSQRLLQLTTVNHQQTYTYCLLTFQWARYLTHAMKSRHPIAIIITVLRSMLALNQMKLLSVGWLDQGESIAWLIRFDKSSARNLLLVVLT